MNNTLSSPLGRERLLLFVLILATTVQNVVWVMLDERPQPFVSAFPELTMQFVDELRDPDFRLSDLPRAVNRISLGPRPPLYQLAAAPFVALVERSIDAMLIVNTLALIVLILATYKLGKLMMGGHAGLLAALFVSTYPPIVNLAKIARPHSIVPAVVALTVWLLFELLLRRSYRTLWLFSAAMAAAFLTHPMSVNLLAIPVTALTIYLAFFQTQPRFPDNARKIPEWMSTKLRDPFVMKGMLPALGTGLVISGGWYVLKLQKALELMERSADTWVGNRMGFTDVSGQFWWYLKTMPGAVSTFFAFLLGLSIVAVFVLKSRANKALYTLLLALLVLMYCIAATRSGTLGWMNFSAALPIVAVLTAIGVMVIVDRILFQPYESRDGELVWWRSASRVREVAAVACLTISVSMAALNYSIVAWGVPRSEEVLRMLGSPLNRACYWRMNIAFCPNPPNRGDWQAHQILEVVLSDPGCEQSVCTLAVLAQNVDMFSNSTLRRNRLMHYPDRTLEVVRTGGDGMRKAIEMNWLTADYIVYLTGQKGTEYKAAITKLIEDPPEEFDNLYEHIGDFGLPNDRTVRLARRAKTLDRERAVALIRTLDISEEMKRQLLDLIESDPLPNG